MLTRSVIARPAGLSQRTRLALNLVAGCCQNMTSVVQIFAAGMQLEVSLSLCYALCLSLPRRGLPSRFSSAGEKVASIRLPMKHGYFWWGSMVMPQVICTELFVEKYIFVDLLVGIHMLHVDVGICLLYVLLFSVACRLWYYICVVFVAAALLSLLVLLLCCHCCCCCFCCCCCCSAFVVVVDVASCCHCCCAAAAVVVAVIVVIVVVAAVVVFVDPAGVVVVLFLLLLLCCCCCCCFFLFCCC